MRLSSHQRRPDDLVVVTAVGSTATGVAVAAGGCAGTGVSVGAVVGVAVSKGATVCVAIALGVDVAFGVSVDMTAAVAEAITMGLAVGVSLEFAVVGVSVAVISVVEIAVLNTSATEVLVPITEVASACWASIPCWASTAQPPSVPAIAPVAMTILIRFNLLVLFAAGLRLPLPGCAGPGWLVLYGDISWILLFRCLFFTTLVCLFRRRPSLPYTMSLKAKG